MSPFARRDTASRAERRPAAEQLAARLPALLAEADRVASTVAQGVHGRRRAGSGDSFWQFRPLMPGESAARIDWRQSARSDRAFVRETEWEAAQTVCIWRDGSPSMRWRSDERLPFKQERAELLALALGILLLRGGEHVRLLRPDGDQARFSGRQSVERLARELLDRPDGSVPSPSLPAKTDLPRHARLVLLGDFLSPPEQVGALLAGFAALPVSPLLLQVLDPAEQRLPYQGRVRFEGVENEAPLLISRTQDAASPYAEAMRAHQQELARLGAAAGASLLRHDTDQPPERALLALHAAIGPRRNAAG